MKNLERINNSIKEMNTEIDRLLIEYEHPMTKLAKYLMKYAAGKEKDFVDIYDKYGNTVKRIQKDPMSILDDIDDEDIDLDDVGDVDMENITKEYDPEMDELIKKTQKAIDRSKKNLEMSSGGIKDSDEDDPIYKKSSRRNYEKITINFRGVNELNVIIGSGQEMKQRLAGIIEFDIITIKETSLGYIMNLQNRNFNKDVTILVYAKNLNRKPQTNSIQLVYNKGKFVGQPKRVTFEIWNIK